MARDDIQVGVTLWSATGKKLGKVVSADQERVLISRGLLSPHDYVVPAASISSLEGRAVLADEGALMPWRSEEEYVEGPQWAAERDAELKVALHEEELVAEKVARVRGHVRVHKRIVTEERTVRVQVRREELRFERVAAPEGDTDVVEAAALSPLGEPLVEHQTYLPLYEEEIEIVKHPKVREWVRITKELVAEPRTYAGQVRREVATVDADGGIAIHTGNDR